MEGIDWKQEYLRVAEALPMGAFLRDEDEEVDMSQVDSADFKDNCSGFVDAMNLVRGVQTRME